MGGHARTCLMPLDSQYTALPVGRFRLLGGLRDPRRGAPASTPGVEDPAEEQGRSRLHVADEEQEPPIHPYLDGRARLRQEPDGDHHRHRVAAAVLVPVSSTATNALWKTSSMRRSRLPVIPEKSARRDENASRIPNSARVRPSENPRGEGDLGQEQPNLIRLQTLQELGEFIGVERPLEPRTPRARCASR